MENLLFLGVPILKHIRVLSLLLLIKEICPLHTKNFCQLHSLSMMADRPILVSALKVSPTFICFRVVNLLEFSLFFIGHHKNNKFTGMGRSRPSYLIGQDCASRA